MVLWKILVWVAGSISNLLGSLCVVIAFELAAINDSSFLRRLVTTRGGNIFDLTDNGFAIDDFTEYDVLVV